MNPYAQRTPTVPWSKLFMNPERETALEIYSLKFLCFFISASLCLLPSLAFSKTVIYCAFIVLILLSYLIIKEQLIFRWIQKKRRLILNREKTEHRSLFQRYRKNITCCKRSYVAAKEENDIESAKEFLNDYQLKIIEDLEKRYGTKIE